MSRTHIAKTLGTTNRAEALRRLQVVVGEIRSQIEEARRTQSGHLKAAPQVPSNTANAELSDARFWRERLAERGGNPNREHIPDELSDDWQREMELRYGEPIGERVSDGGVVERLYDPIMEERGDRFRALVRGAVPVGAELDRYLTERDVKPPEDFLARSVRRYRCGPANTAAQDRRRRRRTGV